MDECTYIVRHPLNPNNLSIVIIKNDHTITTKPIDDSINTIV